MQHLKAYANTAALNGECVDPRFSYVTRGCAEYVEWLGQQENPNGKGWATGAGYGEKILSILKDILAITEFEWFERNPAHYLMEYPYPTRWWGICDQDKLEQLEYIAISPTRCGM